MDFVSELKNKKILVLGGNGFIGKNIVTSLNALEIHPTVVIRKNSHLSYPVSAQTKMLDLNLDTSKALQQLLKQQFDICFQCIGFSGQEMSENHTQLSFKTNVLFQHNLLESAKKHSASTRIIILSSCLEYGKPQYLPLDEKHPLQPNDLYSAQKAFISQSAQRYFDLFGLPVTIVRITNVYGFDPLYQFKGFNIINYFLHLAKQQQPLPVYGSGKQLRDYIYIKDLVEALFHLAATKKSIGEVFNVGSGSHISLVEMAKIIAREGKTSITKISWPKKSHPYERGHVYTSIERLKSATGWNPKYSPEQGVKDCYIELKLSN